MKKTALITGASSGIGKALAHEFARNGYDLVLVSADKTKLESAARELEGQGSTITQLAKDLTKEGTAREIFDELQQKNIEITALVNDAGVGKHGSFHEIAIEDTVELIRLNVEALTKLTKLFLTPMLQRGEGEILNVGSIAGFQPAPYLAVYHASKAFVVSFSQALAEELSNTNIKVTCLCPGATDTEFFERAGMENTRIYNSGMLMSADAVARAGFNALQKGERVHIPGFANKALTFMRRLTPLNLQNKLNKNMYRSIGTGFSQWLPDSMAPGVNVGKNERILSSLSGAAMLVNAIAKRRSPVAKVVAIASSAALLKRGLSGQCDLYKATGMSTSRTEENTPIQP